MSVGVREGPHHEADNPLIVQLHSDDHWMVLHTHHTPLHALDGSLDGAQTLPQWSSFSQPKKLFGRKRLRGSPSMNW